MKKLISLLLVFTMVFSLCVCTTAMADGETAGDAAGDAVESTIKNVALNNIGTWSGGYYAAWGMPSKNMFDGNVGTAGHSDGVGDADGAPVGRVTVGDATYTYAVVDLGMRYTIENINVADRGGRNTYGDNKGLTFDFSNKKDFSEFYNVTAPEVPDAENGTLTHFTIEDEGKTEKYRYVRVRSESSLYIVEIEIYADEATAEEPPVELELIDISEGKTDVWSRGAYIDWYSKNAFDRNAGTQYHCGSTDDGAGGEADVTIDGAVYKWFAINLGKPYTIHDVSWHSRGIDYGENVNVIVDFSNSRSFDDDVFTTETNSAGGDGKFTFSDEAQATEYQYVRFRTTGNFYIIEMYINGYDTFTGEVTEPEEPGTDPDEPGTEPDEPGTEPDEPGNDDAINVPDPDCALYNVALGMDSWSGGCVAAWGATSDEAFDGEWDGFYFPGNDADGGGKLTIDGQVFNYVAVDLGIPYTIEQIQLWDRNGGATYGDNQNLVFELSNSRDFSSDVYKIKANQNPTAGNFKVNVEPDGKAKKYRFVRVRTDSGLYIVEMAVYSSEDKVELNPLRNVALNKTVWCGAWYNDPNDGTHGGAQRAVDDNDTTCFLNGSTPDRGFINGNNFLTVDLGARYTISDIVLNTSRFSMDNYHERDNFEVQLSNYPEFNEYVTVMTVTDAPSHGAEQSVSVSESSKYRYVRVINTDGTEQICLRYLKVYTRDKASDTPIVSNVSFGKYAWAGGHYVAGSDVRSPEMAVDDKANTMYLNGSTVGEHKPGGMNFWAVDLGAKYLIEEIQFDAYDRMSINDNECKYFDIQLANTRDFSDAVTVASYGADAYKARQMVMVNVADKYRYVRFIKNNAEHNESLALADVDVFAADAVKKDVVNLVKGKSPMVTTNYTNSKNGTDGDFNSAVFPDPQKLNTTSLVYDLGADYNMYNIENIVFAMTQRDNDQGHGVIENYAPAAKTRIYLSNDPNFEEEVVLVYNNNTDNAAVPRCNVVDLENGNLVYAVRNGEFKATRVAMADERSYRYVKVESTGAVRIWELQVEGSRIDLPAGSHFRWYTDETLSNEIGTFTADGAVALCFDLRNISSASTTNCDVYLATYVGKKLEKIEKFNHSSGAYVNAKFVKMVNVEYGKNYKAFAWKQGTLKPVGTSTELK